MCGGCVYVFDIYMEFRRWGLSNFFFVLCVLGIIFRFLGFVVSVFFCWDILIYEFKDFWMLEEISKFLLLILYLRCEFNVIIWKKYILLFFKIFFGYSMVVKYIYSSL